MSSVVAIILINLLFKNLTKIAHKFKEKNRKISILIFPTCIFHLHLYTNFSIRSQLHNPEPGQHWGGDVSHFYDCNDTPKENFARMAK